MSKNPTPVTGQAAQKRLIAILEATEDGRITREDLARKMGTDEWSVHRTATLAWNRNNPDWRPIKYHQKEKVFELLDHGMVTVTGDGPIREIVFDRPKANAISLAASRALSRAFCAFRDDHAASVAILTGGGEKFFSAGWDLKAAAAGEETDASTAIEGGFAGLTELWSLDKPVIAAVNGLAVGGGFELALAADVVVAAENAQFWLPEAQLGILPDGGGVVRLQRRLPRQLAVEMMMTGRRLSAAEGLRWGLISRVVPQAELMAAAREIAAAMTRSAPLSLRAIKAVVEGTEGLSVQEAYALMRSGAIPQYRACLDSEDAREGPASFAEGRPPVWKGR